MKRWLIGALAAVVTVIAAPKTTHADHNRWLPALPTATELRVLARGYGIYCLDKEAAAYPNFRAQVRQVYDNEADQTVGVGIPWVESTTGNDCDIEHYMVHNAQFPCGTGAAACTYFSNDPVVVYYGEDLLYYDWKTTIGHEHGHWDGSHERYIDSAGRLICDPNATYTRNSCGTGVWSVQPYDQLVAWNAMVPDRPLNVSMDVIGGWARVRWDQYRADCVGINLSSVSTNLISNIYGGYVAHFDCLNDVATRMAFGHSNGPGQPISWIGDTCGARFNYCYSDYKNYERDFDPFWKGCIYIHAENTALWWVPQVSSPNFWTLAGCY